jgi:hypothetical protein
MAILNDGTWNFGSGEVRGIWANIELLRWLPDRAIQALSECIKQGLRTPYREGIMSR